MQKDLGSDHYLLTASQNFSLKNPTQSSTIQLNSVHHLLTLFYVGYTFALREKRASLKTAITISKLQSTPGKSRIKADQK